MFSNRLGSILNNVNDVVVFAAMMIYFLNSKVADPGDYVFLIVYENTMMLISFAIFFLVSHSFFNKSYSNFGRVYLKKDFNSIIKGFTTSIVAIVTFVVSAGIIILILNQLTIELLVAYLKDNGYKYQSIFVLDSHGLFLKSETLAAMKELFGKNYTFFFWAMGIQFFISYFIHFFTLAKNSKKEEDIDPAFWDVAIQILLSPICIFIVCIVLVILSSIFGTQFWIVSTTLILYKIIFTLTKNKLSKVLNT